MSYTVPPLCGSLHVFGAPLNDGPIYVRGFPNHPSLAGTSAGSDSVCPLVRIEEEASSDYCLLQQAVSDPLGDDASSFLGHFLKSKRPSQKF